MEKRKLKSAFDGLELELGIENPEGEAVGLVVLSHGMEERKERYEDFMKFLAGEGYIAVIYDHRGHGASVKNGMEDLGFFYTKDIQGISSDLRQVMEYARKEFPGLPLYLFSHSMGTLVARCLLKQDDSGIKRAILCGAPTKRAGVGGGLFLIRLLTVFTGEKYRSSLLDAMVMKEYNKGFKKKNSWLSTVDKTVDNFNEDPLCGVPFTNNGYYNLLSMMKEVFRKDGWCVKNPELPLLLIAGENDPVIQSREKLVLLADFLKGRGYRNVRMNLYQGRRHEILNEKKHEEVYQDILKFLKGETVEECNM